MHDASAQRDCHLSVSPILLASLHFITWTSHTTMFSNCESLKSAHEVWKKQEMWLQLPHSVSTLFSLLNLYRAYSRCILQLTDCTVCSIYRDFLNLQMNTHVMRTSLYSSAGQLHMRTFLQSTGYIDSEVSQSLLTWQIIITAAWCTFRAIYACNYDSVYLRIYVYNWRMLTWQRSRKLMWCRLSKLMWCRLRKLFSSAISLMQDQNQLSACHKALFLQRLDKLFLAVWYSPSE